MRCPGVEEFFQQVPVAADFAELTDFEHYAPLPSEWVLAITDVVDSRGAIAKGHYKSVNMAGASAISALLNALGSQNYPFVFGGDGAVLALPGEQAATATRVLGELIVWVSEVLRLQLRAAIVPVSDIRFAGFDVLVARHRVSESVTYTMFSGGGCSWAERQLKSGHYAVRAGEAGSRPDLTGLSCRWDPIPSAHGDVVSVIIRPGATGNGDDFKKLLLEVIGIVSEQERNGHPLPIEGPPIAITMNGIDHEARATAVKGLVTLRKISILASTAFAVWADRLGLKLGSFEARRYKMEVASNSDFRKFEDSLKMTVDLSAERSDRLEQHLSNAASMGLCKYGLHKQSEALMTCYVPTLATRNHFHFIDGADGGYAIAASKI